MPTTRGGPKKRKTFTWTYLPAQEKILIQKKTSLRREHDFSVQEIENILRRLEALFGKGFFPLANNVEKLGDGTERQGLGTSILEQRAGDTYHAQGSSYLGVVMEECGYFQWNGKHVGIEWRLIDQDFRPEKIRERLQKASKLWGSKTPINAEQELTGKSVGFSMDFNSRAKEHLAQYKTTRLGVNENGLWKQKNMEYPHILPERLWKLNILETYRQEFWEYHSRCHEIKLHKDFHHLNSSQAMCFNLFFPLIADSDFQMFFLKEVLQSEEKSRATFNFEEIPDPTEGTNFDFVIEFETGPRYLFELKYTEKEFGKARNDENHVYKLQNIYKIRLQGLVRPEALEPHTFFLNYQILRNISYLNRKTSDLLILVFPRSNNHLTKTSPSVFDLLTNETRDKMKCLFLEDIITTILGSANQMDPILGAHYRLFAEKYLPDAKLHFKNPTAEDFSDMDTSVYEEEASKYLPTHTKFIFIGESPPAFKDKRKMAYFYFKESAGDLLFANIVKAVFDIDYKKNPAAKESLLKRFAEDKGCFLIDAVTYPINKDRNGNKKTDKERRDIIRKQKPKLLEMLHKLERAGKITPETGIILLKETVHKALYEELRERYKVVNHEYIGFPRWHGDPVFVQKIRQLLA